MALEKKTKKAAPLTLANVDKRMHDKFGKDIFVSAKSIIDTPKMIIPVSPALDLSLGGGIQEGGFVVITGPPKVGKTSMCLHFASIAQQPQYNSLLTPSRKNRKVFFFNVEGRIKARDLAGVPGLLTSINDFQVIKSVPGRILNAEDYLEILEAYIHTYPGAIFIIDSISQLCSSMRMASGIGDRIRDDVPLMISNLTKRVSNVLPINDSIVMCITHMYANQDPKSMKKWAEASGQKIQYAREIKLRATHSTPYMDGDVQVGQIVHWVCDTSSIGPPGGKADSLLRYGGGLDKEYELVQLGKDLNLITVAGSWYTIGDDKMQGADKAANFLRENPDIFNDLHSKFREMMGLNHVC